MIRPNGRPNAPKIIYDTRIEEDGECKDTVWFTVRK